MIAEAKIEPLIIVGIYNTGEHRIDEYTPSIDPSRGKGGQAYLYSKMLRREIKPLVDREFRTRPEPEDTGLGGASLGGLVTLSIGLRFPQIFGKLAVISPSLWWGDELMLKRVQALPEKLPLRIWLDMGLEEGDTCVEDCRHMREALQEKGWVEGDDFQHWEFPGARHTESAWAARMGQILEFLFPPAKSEQPQFSSPASLPPSPQ